ncbi:hypothetical protein C9F11_08950 [Streptomyces sp. YIM 121038]|uniref:hypothetical protein n=1 Tax=Streptomyces sp. YIM 121038 TaxID=2136401 RepID=UPI001110188D|nr:hypothetical protein [Streptomyces sp. YIM 121038]QCX75479.1 hypothetical protein C9F11_08950 [Streptomyces sp. YIM 121038]
MAGVTWTRSGLRSRRGPYQPVRVSDRFDPGLAAFVNSALNGLHQQVEQRARTIAAEAERSVRTRSRVDTGYMKTHVEKTVEAGRQHIAIEFGWLNDDPEYAKYQEFGTRRGIAPMFAVKGAFDEALAKLNRLI